MESHALLLPASTLCPRARHARSSTNSFKLPPFQPPISPPPRLHPPPPPHRLLPIFQNVSHISPPCMTFALAGLLATSLLTAQSSSAAEIEAGKSLVDEFLAISAQEPKNALSLPTWTIHVASVVEWVVAMVLVWKYGDTPRNAAWKSLSWGMVPLLGGAMCACTWHFFYNAESLEVLVAFQAALTVIGNFTMWLAAFRIYQSTQGGSKAS